MFSRPEANRNPSALRRSVLGWVAVLWLNMAVLPCAMAFQGDDDCPHCPPAGQHEKDHNMASHHGDHQDDARPSCSSVQADCCDAIAASVDARGGKLDYKPASDLVFVTAPLPENRTIRRGAQCYGALDPPDISGSSPPLHVLFCVYLD